ncbi:hypothetical protein [Actinoplanes sp. NPDC051494]|uniref:hypothetical protein n=1 Tax=Actinoplanes sp. NPDC051494 TaxID=3363907 RepID=UPI0037B6E8F0
MVTHTWTDLAYQWFGDISFPWWGWVAWIVAIFGAILGPGVAAANARTAEDEE